MQCGESARCNNSNLSHLRVHFKIFLPFAGALTKARIERRSVSGEEDWDGQNPHSGSAERPKRAAHPLQRGQREVVGYFEHGLFDKCAILA